MKQLFLELELFQISSQTFMCVGWELTAAEGVDLFTYSLLVEIIYIYTINESNYFN